MSSRASRFVVWDMKTLGFFRLCRCRVRRLPILFPGWTKLREAWRTAVPIPAFITERNVKGKKWPVGQRAGGSASATKWDSGSGSSDADPHLLRELNLERRSNAGSNPGEISKHFCKYCELSSYCFVENVIAPIIYQAE